MSFKEHVGDQGSLLPKIATGFGGGIGGKGSLCGAFTGSVMVFGMKFGRTEPGDKERKEKVYGLGHRFWERFEKEIGSCYCYDLIKCRLDNPEERKKWLESGGLEKCSSIVEKAAGLLGEFLQESE